MDANKKKNRPKTLIKILLIIIIILLALHACTLIQSNQTSSDNTTTDDTDIFEIQCENENCEKEENPKEDDNSMNNSESSNSSSNSNKNSNSNSSSNKSSNSNKNSNSNSSSNKNSNSSSNSNSTSNKNSNSNSSSNSTSNSNTITEEAKIHNSGITWSSTNNLKIFSNPVYDMDPVIAPESTNTYRFIVRNNTDYNISYNLTFIENNSYHINMKYRLKLGDNYVAGDENTWVSYGELDQTNISLAKQKDNTYSLEWKWVSSDNDTSIGSNIDADYQLNLNIKAEQKK